MSKAFRRMSRRTPARTVIKSVVRACAGKSPRGLAVGDFNGDGKLDLAVAEFGDNAVTIFVGNGDGTFQSAPNSFGLGSGGLGPAALAVGDFNSDGILDLAVADQGS